MGYFSCLFYLAFLSNYWPLSATLLASLFFVGSVLIFYMRTRSQINVSSFRFPNLQTFLIFNYSPTCSFLFFWWGGGPCSATGRPTLGGNGKSGIQNERKHPWSNRWETRAASWDWSDKNSSTQAGRSVNDTQQETREESRSVREEERQTRGNCVQYLI